MKNLSGYPFGETLRNSSVAGFTLTETAYPPILKLPKHSHVQAYFCFVLGGSFTEDYGSRSRSCRASTLIFHPAGESHSDQFHTSTHCFNVQMNDRWLATVGQHSGLINIPADFRSERLAHLVMGIYREFYAVDVFSALVIEGLTLELIVEASRHLVKEQGNTPLRWLAKAREILDERFSECLTLVEIAELVDVHPTHLAREFRRFYRCTVGEYVRQRRVEFACPQIAASDAPFSEIALAVMTQANIE